MLNDIEWVAIKSERVLKWSVGRQLVFKQYFTIYSDLDFAGYEGEIQNDRMLFSTYGEVPSESLFTGLDMFTDLLDIKPDRKDRICHYE